MIDTQISNAKTNLLYFRDVLICINSSNQISNNDSSYSHSFYFQCDSFTSVFVLSTEDTDETILPIKICSEELFSSLSQISPSFPELSFSQEKQNNKILQSIFTIKGNITQVHFLQNPNIPSCTDCGFSKSETTLHKALR